MNIKCLSIRFDIDQDLLIAEEKDGTLHYFNEFQLREARELFRRYDEADFQHDDDEEIDAFHEFSDRMAVNSPEALEVVTPYLN